MGSAQSDKAADTLRDHDDRLDALMDAALENVLAYMDDLKEHWNRLASTNPS